MVRFDEMIQQYMPILTIMISTLNEGIYKLQKMTGFIDERIAYLVVHQYTDDRLEIPDFLIREDIQVIQVRDKGLSKSRNIAFEQCKTPYGLIADDDLAYIDGSLLQVLDILETNTDLGFATFKIRTKDGEPDYKEYPDEKYKIDPPQHWFTSSEILVNVEQLREKDISMDVRFGLGTLLERGEEDILVHDMIEKEMRGWFYPLFLYEVPFESSGRRKRKVLKELFFRGAFNRRMGIPMGLHHWKSYIVSPFSLLKDVSKICGMYYIKWTNV